MPRPPRRRHLPLLAAALIVSAPLACGPEEEADVDNPLARVTDTLAEDTVLPESAQRGPGADLEAQEDTTPGAAVTFGRGDPGDGGAEPPPVEEGAGDLPPWSRDSVGWRPEDRPSPVTVAGLRIDRHDGFDRWVVELEGPGLPGYGVAPVEAPLTECGSGRRIDPDGESWLRLRLEPARGHTEAGEATLPKELDTPDLVRGVEVYRTCDFEGVVSLVLALRSAEPFRAFHLTDPGRVFVDVRH